jgi:hypothetical protein
LNRAPVRGAATDPDLKALLDQLEQQRLEGLGRMAAVLAGRGSLRPDLSVEEARDIIWTLCSPAVYDLLVVERGWSSNRYRGWLATALSRELLDD